MWLSCIMRRSRLKLDSAVFRDTSKTHVTFGWRCCQANTHNGWNASASPWTVVPSNSPDTITFKITSHLSHFNSKKTDALFLSSFTVRAAFRCWSWDRQERRAEMMWTVRRQRQLTTRVINEQKQDFRQGIETVAWKMRGKHGMDKLATTLTDR